MFKNFYFACMMAIIISCSNERKIQCKLIEPAFPDIKCGVVSVWTSMKFINSKDSSFFIGLVHCADAYDSAFFVKNANYVITINSKMPDKSKNVITNKFAQEKLSTFTIEDIKLQ
jgi:hypothetical protein